MNYSIILSQNTRTDDYVNATEICSQFDRRLDRFLRTKETKAYLEALRIKLSKTTPNRGILDIKRGKGGGTYVHPLVAVKLAEWISPEFDVYVKETFKRYLENDVTLADEIIQREEDPEKLKWLAVRANGKVARRAFTDALQARGVTRFGYADNTNAIYLPIFGKSARDLQSVLNNPNPRDGMSLLQLSAVAFAEQLAIQRMVAVSAMGNKDTKQCSYEVATQVASLIRVTTN